MKQASSQALRVFALGQFSEPIPPLAVRLAALKVAPLRIGTVEQLPDSLASNDILLTELAWLSRLPVEQRSDLAHRASTSSAWVALTDQTARFKDQINWQRLGVKQFFPRPLDPERLAGLVENIHDRIFGAPIRAILIDDDESSLAYYSEVLRQAGIQVLATPDPLLLIDSLDEHKPDVLVLDVEMPGCLGTELATIVRQHPAYARLPVIFLTAMDDMRYKLLARAAAAEDFLAKPVAPELLLAAVESHALRNRAFLRADALAQRQQEKGRLRLEQMRQVVDEHAIVSIADAAGNILEVNDLFCSISGYTRRELLGQNHRLLKSGRHPNGFYAEMWETISTGNTWHGELCNRSRDGREYWVRSTIAPIPGADGLPEKYISIRTDITYIKAVDIMLRENELRYRSLVNSVSVGIVLHDTNGAITECNPAAERILGLPREQILGRQHADSAWRCIHPDGRSYTEQDYPAIRTLRTGVSLRDVLIGVYRSDGSLVWISAASEPICDPDHPEHVKAVVVSFTDVTERRYVDARFAFAVEGAGDGVWDWHVATGNMPFSGNYEGMLGYAKGEIPENIDAWVSMVHPLDLPRIQQTLADYLEGRIPLYTVEVRLRCKDGGYKWILCRGTLVERAADGKPARMIGIHSDISERKHAEEELLVFRRLVETTDQAIRVADREGLIQYVNPAYQALLGYRPEEVIGQDFAQIGAAHGQESQLDEVMAHLDSGEGWRGFLKLRRKDGSEFISQSNIRSITAPDTGEILHSFNMFIDYSEEKARQEALIAAREAADRANQAKSEFLSSMSHELRTPMNAIIGFAQMLEYDSEMTADQQDNVHEILKAGRHLLDLINEVLDLAKIESGRVDLSMEGIELSALGEDCRHLIQPIADKAGIGLFVEFHAAHVVFADRVRLKQVLLNLLSNAIKYNQPNGTVRLGVAPGKPDHLRLVVTDSGVGIAPDRLKEVFQPFNRLGAEASEIEGTGIGLTITRRLVEMMGGEMGVDSALGIGSTFWVELAIGQTANLATGETESDDHAPVGANMATATVLAIDDNPANLKLIAKVMGMRNNIHLLSAHTPELGIELAMAHRPDLILLDINMPGMDGYQVLEILKANTAQRAIPVIAITANAMPHDIERGKKAGFADYLTKPIEIGTLIETVEHCLAHTQRAST
jgi:PAS domain S-box-containing protein